MSPKVTLFVHGLAPNPPKVAILLEELGVDYAIINKEFGDGQNGVKAPDFLKVNPNGRVPALIDHTNNDHVVWESGAILLYVAERFDPSCKFIGNTLEERSQVWEWLMFQVSGLGPMQGQLIWFKRFHPVKDLDPSVIERYQNETNRVYGVISKRLEEQGEWVALKRFTVADMAIYGWLKLYTYDPTFENLPTIKAYYERIEALPSVRQAYAKLAAAK